MYPVFQAAIEDLLAQAKTQGLLVGQFMGDRTFDQQDTLYALGRTVKNLDGFDPVKCPMGRVVTRAKGGDSWHNYGLAADIVFRPTPKSWSWDSKHRWVELGAIGIRLGLEWGGIWYKFPDLPHFQYTNGLTIEQAKTLYAKDGLEAVWNEVASRGRGKP
jgi:peptidoglycan L-alanyl-D-glutamate endopeptidase CwlK